MFGFLFLKKPYLKKIGQFSGLTAWVVDGKWVRDHIYREFVSYACYHPSIRGAETMQEIPKNEIWLDQEMVPGDAMYYIDNIIARKKFISQGKTFVEAVRLANMIELKERRKSDFIKKHINSVKDFKNVIKKIHKNFLSQYSIPGKLSTWIVNGELARGLAYLNYFEGGHDLVYPFIPKNEIWLDDDLTENEISYVFFHEIHERNLMAMGWSYNPADHRPEIEKINKKGKIKRSAHYSASQVEYYCRHHPNKLVSRIKAEMAIASKLKP